MPTNEEKALLQFLDERPLPDVFKDWITEKQFQLFVKVSSKTLRNVRYEKGLTHTVLFRIPFYYVPDLLELMKETMVWREK